MFEPGTILNQRYKVLRQRESGGFSLIFEVKDIRQRNLKNGFGLQTSRSTKILKALNYSGHQRQDAEFLFRREISLLKRLKHPQIVQYVDDFDYIDGRRLTPCLILEKVPGQTLENWLQKHGPISEEIALDWLSQCANVLEYLHNEQRIIHLDIKPANLILKPSGELVFIDFGIARLISQTLFADLLDEEGRKVGTDWYMAPEQSQGKPVTQSDIYALGRLIIQALANLPEEHIPQDDEGEWQWDTIEPTLSPEIRKLLDGMTNRYVRYRFSNIQEIAHTVESIQDQYFAEEITLVSKVQKFIAWKLLPSTSIAGLVILMRFLGLLQPLEIFTYDQLVRLRLDTEGPDPRMFIIEVTALDVARQNELGIRDSSSLSNEALKRLLEKLEAYNPSVIAIDIYREQPIPESNHQDIISGCSVSLHEPDHQIAPPPQVEPGKFGFFDMPSDPWDGGVRRQLIAASGGDHCDPGYSFSYQVAKTYLKKNNISVTEDGELKINSRLVNRITRHEAFYAGFNDSGYQVLVNYRTYRRVANSATLFEVLEDRIPQERLKELVADNIILIGTTDQSYGDTGHLTPYGSASGIIVQAHKISNLINLGFEDRRTITYLPRQLESVGILLLTLISSLRSSRKKVLRYGSITFFMSISYLCMVYLVFSAKSFLLPITPALIALAAICVSNVVLLSTKPKVNKLKKKNTSSSKMKTRTLKLKSVLFFGFAGLASFALFLSTSFLLSFLPVVLSTVLTSIYFRSRA